MALDSNLDAGNVTSRNSGRCIDFCEQPLHSEVGMDDVRGPLADLENVGLTDPMKKIRNVRYRGKVAAEVPQTLTGE